MDFPWSSGVKLEKAKIEKFSETVWLRIMKAVRFLELTIFLKYCF